MVVIGSDVRSPDRVRILMLLPSSPPYCLLMYKVETSTPVPMCYDYILCGLRDDNP